MMRALLLAPVIACSTTATLPSARFANAPPVGRVDDRRDVRKPPAERTKPLMLYYFDGAFLRLATRSLELRGDRRALGVNAIDEVPDSTWFTNRIGVRELTLDELRRGPEIVGSPEPYKPWTIKSTKVGGKSTGFMMTDSRGEKYLLKFEVPEYPEAETAADAITSRILWACGYNVPEDHVVYVRRDELVLASGATIKDVFGNKRPLTAAELDARLAGVAVGTDGRMRATVSRLVPGKTLGGHPGEGVRADDPNDRIPHELRRDLRGQYSIWAWLDHVDIKEHNTLDVWAADPRDPARHYVEHYQIDFGKSLGVMGVDHRDPRSGHTYNADYGEMLASLASGGMYERPWEHRVAPGLLGVGLYDASSFDPGRWKPNTQAYVPLLTADRFDKFWGAKIAIRFTREQLRVIVETGRLTDPRAVDYLVDTLVARQRATAKYWFDRVAPLDRFTVAEGAMCFEDLALKYQLGSPVTTTYTVRVHDRAGRVIGSAMIEPRRARTCASLELANRDDGYTMIAIDVARPQSRTGVIVHVAREPVTQRPRVIGLWRR